MHMSYFFYLFFFKQKTAYGVRISDWSSAVCSSDLRDARPPPADLTGRPDVDLVEAVADFRRWLSAQPAEPKTLDLVDRKSVASGKSVSVRVDLGGRRIIKQNTLNKHTYIKTITYQIILHI